MSELTLHRAGRSQVFSKLCCLLQAIPGVESAAELNEQTLISDLALDSLRLVEIIFELERHFNCVADEGLMAEARTLDDVVSLFCCVTNEASASV